MKKDNQKHNAFTFVELLLVMFVLGIIITLTMPLLQNIKNDDDLYRAYMKKAVHDVTDATALVFLRERYLTDFSRNSLQKLVSIYGKARGNKYEGCSDGDNTCANCTGLRAVYNLLAVPGTTCTGNACFTDGVDTMLEDAPGIKIGSKSVMQFYYEENLMATPPTFGNIYIDVNGNKKPNKPCQDRYKFVLYLDRAVMDSTEDYSSCSLEL